LVTCTGLLRFEPEVRVKLTVAMTPSGIVLALRPINRQVYEPLAPKQVKDLPALVALGPAVTLIALKSAGEYENVQFSPDGTLTAEFSERLRTTLPPTGATSDERDTKPCAEVIEMEARSRVDKSAHLGKQHCRMFIGLEIFSFL
jgi:hypothetical protein